MKNRVRVFEIGVRHIGHTESTPHSTQQHTWPHGRNTTLGGLSRQTQHSPCTVELSREAVRVARGAVGFSGVGTEGSTFQASGNT